MKHLEQYLPTARALVFVIDAENIREDVRDPVDFFVKIASNETLYSRTSKKSPLPVLFVCNKQDCATAKSDSAVKKLFEKEIEILKSAHTKAAGNLMTTAAVDNEDEERDVEQENVGEIFYSALKNGYVL